MYYVYILLCDNDSLYTGIAKDVQRRFEEHRKGKGAKYTRTWKVKKILYTEEFTSKENALKREVLIKSWSREMKINLINNGKTTE